VIGRFVREAARPFYGEGVGRRSIDPTVLVRPMLAGALEGIGSMRELLRVADLRLDLRLFLGGGFGERLPAHQAVSEAQRRRFAEGEVFERLFLRTVAFCKRHGLIEGSDLSVDGVRVEADAALRSLRASLGPIDGGARAEPAAAGGGGAAASGPPQRRLAEPRSGPTPKRAATNATALSFTGPEARAKGKPGQRPRLVYSIMTCSPAPPDVPSHATQAAEPLIRPGFVGGCVRWRTALVCCLFCN
jgi:transposase